MGFAIWRLSSMIAVEDGPFYVFAKLRHLAGMRYDEHSTPLPQNEFARGLVCVWCLSVWVAMLVSLFYWFCGTMVVWMLFPFALSGVVIAVDTLVNGRS